MPVAVSKCTKPRSRRRWPGVRGLVSLSSRNLKNPRESQAERNEELFSLMRSMARKAPFMKRDWPSFGKSVTWKRVKTSFSLPRFSGGDQLLHWPRQVPQSGPPFLASSHCFHWLAEKQSDTPSSVFKAARQEALTWRRSASWGRRQARRLEEPPQATVGRKKVRM